MSRKIYFLENIYMFAFNRHEKSPSGDNGWAGDKSQIGRWTDGGHGAQVELWMNG